ncbi:MAG TPA: hypothetical protein GXZ76_07120, partial [Clostridiaceae bacterium]|nr:hypothetical protein [Clostridiaceae bacterium]
MRIKYFITKSAKIILTTIILLIASIIFCSGEPEVHAAEIDDTDIVLSGDEGITKDTDQQNIELPPSSEGNIPAAPGSADEELSSDSKAVEENMNVPEAADESKSESGSESESESKLELDSESATNTGTEEQLDSEGSINSNEPADSEEPINSEEPLIEPDAELTASSGEEVLSDQVLLLSAFAAKKVERKDGVYIIDNVPYVYDNAGNLVKNAW